MNHHLTPTDWAYLAGFIDGEGCISTSKVNESWYPRLGIAQADQVMLLDLHRKFDVGRFRLRKVGRSKATGINGAWTIRANSELRWLLEGVLPYLTLKRGQAEVALELLLDHHDQRKVVELSELKVARRPHGKG